MNSLLDEHIGHVAERIRELKVLEKTLKALRLQCGDAHAAKDWTAASCKGFGYHGICIS